MTENHDADATMRRRVEELSQQALLRCYQCGRCSAGCPMAPWMDALPNQLIRRLQLDLDPGADAEAPWVCASCLVCGIRCPKGIDVPRVMEALRVVRLRAGLDHTRPETLTRERIGRLPTIALVAHMRKVSA